MPKTSHFFLLCSVLAVPFLGSLSAHAFTIVNPFGQCLEDRDGEHERPNPDRGQVLLRALFPAVEVGSGFYNRHPSARQWTGIGRTRIAKCLTAFGSADGTPVTLVTCQRVLHGLQKWIHVFPGQIINVSLGKCLTVEDPIAGTQMTVRTCDPNNGNQLLVAAVLSLAL